MFKRKTTGSVVCPSCGSLVGVRDDKCYSCGRANPGPLGICAGAAAARRRPRLRAARDRRVGVAVSSLTLLLSGAERADHGRRRSRSCRRARAR